MGSREERIENSTLTIKTNLRKETALCQSIKPCAVLRCGSTRR